MAIISTHNISFAKLQEKVNMTEQELKEALRPLIENHIVHEKNPKHKPSERSYEIESRYHNCLCILLATLEMQRFSLEGSTYCAAYGDYPITFN